MLHRPDCPECGASLLHSPGRCADCGWRPWYLVPKTVGLALLCIVAVALDLRAAFLVAVPPDATSPNFPFNATQEFVDSPPPRALQVSDGVRGSWPSRGYAHPLSDLGSASLSGNASLSPSEPSPRGFASPSVPDTALRAPHSTSPRCPFTGKSVYTNPR